MNYRRIEPSCSIDTKLDSLLMQIAKWHNVTPKLWMPDFKATSEDIEKTILRIKQTKKEDLFLMIVEDELYKLQGYIWAYKQERPQDSIMILSLYITDSLRGRGIATNLKKMLEQWCRHEGIKSIQTTTHYNNHNMIALNQKLGYTPGMVCMTKDL